MASNYNRKSASSGSRKKPARTRGQQSGKSSRSTPSASSSRASSRPSSPSSNRTPSKRSARSSQQSTYRAVPGGRYASTSSRPQPRYTSVRVGDLDRGEREGRTKSTYRRYLVRIAIIASIIVAFVIGGVVAYHSNLFEIENVVVSGVEHLTTEEMTTLANVPAKTTLLRVDAEGIRQRMLKTSWAKDVEVKRVFPNTLELVVTERTISAVVEVPTENAKSVKKWAIASDHMWLMPIPEQDSEAGKKTSQKIYEDAAAVLSITEVPYGTKAEIGTYCVDETVNNALDIVSGMTTDLAEQVVQVSTAGPEETRLVLKNGVEITFGKADRIRDKERVCLKIMEENPEVVYINVRVVDRPTWRAV